MDFRFRHAAAVLLFISMLPVSSTVLGQATSAPPPETARVMLLSLDKGKHQLCIDKAAAVALSDPHSFVTLSITSGWHLLWGSAKPEWFRFEAGRSYALIYSAEIKRWCLDDTLHAQLFISEKKLRQVALGAADLSTPGPGVTSEKFDKMRARAGEPVEPRLPADFEAVYRKSSSPLASHFTLDRPKKVHVDAEAISIDGGVTIPIAEINMLQFYGIDKTNSVGMLPWAAVLFKSVEEPSLALLGVVGNYNGFFSMVELARAGARVRSDTTGVSK